MCSYVIYVSYVVKSLALALQSHMPYLYFNIAVAAFIIGAGDLYRTFGGNKELFFTRRTNFIKFIIDIPIHFAYIA